MLVYIKRSGYILNTKLFINAHICNGSFQCKRPVCTLIRCSGNSVNGELITHLPMEIGAFFKAMKGEVSTDEVETINEEDERFSNLGE